MISVTPNEEKDYPDAKRSVTDYVVIEKVSHRATWLGLSPITGRTHQLRSHMSAIGCPIIGDTKYGTRGQVNEGEGWGSQIGGIISRKLHLHARSITFEHPFTKKLIFVEADLPVHMSKAWDTFNWNLKWAPKDPFAIYE
jgi:23S rRNA pseudouridine955/2504/2580 synthase